MGILNYTTSISAGRTVGEIQGMLARQGAKSILMDFDEGTPISVSFLIKTQFGDRGFRLPANADGVYKVLEDQWQQGAIKKTYVSEQQAARIAWRIVKDWLEAQLALIQAGMATLDEIMLPYLTDGTAHGMTLYQVMRRNQMQLPEGKG